ncbi:hypothetical protein G7Y89_g567 [Cudoniella acicularis]|uniref:MYND-type domain-containing protein n=1 Tax=Cudoniella acicularis TaxID=354080 RepID=A0A8H4RYX8_9HELO|nr:hypothetical protein G7Y89_g567 [Cudoniella acicularis]
MTKLGKSESEVSESSSPLALSDCHATLVNEQMLNSRRIEGFYAFSASQILSLFCVPSHPTSTFSSQLHASASCKCITQNQRDNCFDSPQLLKTSAPSTQAGSTAPSDPSTTSSASAKMIATKCTACNDPASRTCATCRDAKYCSPECQRTDWKTHKLICRALEDLDKPPSPLRHRAILLLADSTKPKFVWVKYDFDEETGEAPEDIGKTLGGHVGLKDFDYNPVRDRQLPHELMAYFISDFMNTNDVSDFLCTAVNEDFNCGNFDSIVLTSYKDFDFAGFRNLVDNLCFYSINADPPFMEGPATASRARKLKADSLGIPIISHVVKIRRPTLDEGLFNLNDRQVLLFSALHTLHKVLDYGLDVHLVRENGKELLPEHVEAFAGFVLENVGGLWVENDNFDYMAIGSLLERDNADAIGEAATKENWDKYWDQYKEKKGWGENIKNPRLT